MKRGILLLLVAFACRGGSPELQVAEKFLDAYYVNIDLAGASAFAEGYALSKIEEGKALTAGQAIDATTRRPAIQFKQVKKEAASPDEVNLLYELTIQPPNARSFSRQTYLKMRRTDGIWKVALFREL